MSEERELLRSTVAALVDKHATPEAVRTAMESDRGYDESLWKLLCEQVGAAALVIPDDLGGAGGELADAAVVLEELGKALVPTPLLGTTLAELALLHAGDHESLEGLAEGASIGTVVFDPEYVVNGDIADIVIAADGTELTRWTNVTAQPHATMDLTRRLSSVTAGETAALGTDPGLSDTAALLLAAEQIGAAARALDLTVAYTKDRVQFGRPIGSFQAVSSRLADGYIDIKGLRLTLTQAAWRLSEDLPADVDVASAAFWAAEAGHRVAHTTVHVHGGVGIDTDHPVHRYFLAAKQTEFALGGATGQLLRIGRELADTPA